MDNPQRGAAIFYKFSLSSGNNGNLGVWVKAQRIPYTVTGVESLVFAVIAHINQAVGQCASTSG